MYRAFQSVFLEIQEQSFVGLFFFIYHLKPITTISLLYHLGKVNCNINIFPKLIVASITNIKLSVSIIQKIKVVLSKISINNALKVFTV